LLAENEDSFYTAYVSQQNLIPDADAGPIEHPDITDMFDDFDGDRYTPRRFSIN
jgi:heat shock protein HspQ